MQIKKNELRKVVKDNGSELKIANHMQTYSSNIVGSNTYFYTKRREVEMLIDQQDHCTIRYSLSVANNH